MSTTELYSDKATATLTTNNQQQHYQGRKSLRDGKVLEEVEEVGQLEGGGIGRGGEATHIKEPADSYLTGLPLTCVIVGLSFAVLLVALDVSFLATAIPTITSEFHSIQDVGWYSTTFLITSCACIPLAGKSFAQFSPKWTFLTFLVIFEIGSLICALSPSSIILIIGRAIAGVGAAGLLPGSIIIVAHVGPIEKRALLTSIVVSTFSLATVFGPVVGGAFTQHVTWRWCFYINLPLGAITFTTILFLFVSSVPQTACPAMASKIGELDLVGFCLFSPAVVMLLLALQWGGTSQHPWHSSMIIGLLVGFGLTMALFIAWQRRVGDRASLPGIIMKRTVVLAASGAFLANGAAQVVVFYLPLWFQAVQGASPTDSGVRYLAAVIANVIFSILGGAFIGKTGYFNPPFLLGMALLALGSGLMVTLMSTSSTASWIGFQILFGVGYGLTVQIPLVVAQTTLPVSYIPMGSSLMTFSQLFGGSVLIAVAQNIFQTELYHRLRDAVPASDAQKIFDAGAVQFRRVVDAQQLPLIIDLFSAAITRTFYVAAIAPVLGFVLVAGMQWTKVQPASKEDHDSV